MRCLAALALVLFVALPARAEKIAVRVTAGGKPVADAGVVALEPEKSLVFDRARFQPSARTDAEGIAVLELPARARLADHHVVVHRDGDAIAIARLSGRVVDVALRDEWPFTGKVVDADEKPVAGADLYLRARGPVTLRTRSNAKGEFAFSGGWFDDYALRIEAEGFLPEERGELTERDDGRTWAVQRPATLTVTLTDEKKKPLAGWPLRCGETRKTTDAQGRVRFERLRPGSVAVEADAPYTLIRPTDRRLADGANVSMQVRGVAPAILRLSLASRGGAKLKHVRCTVAERPVTRDDNGVWSALVTPSAAAALLVQADGHLPATFRFRAPAPGDELDLGELVLDAHPVGKVIVRAPDGGAPPDGTANSVAARPVAIEKGLVELPVGEWTITVAGFVPTRVEVVSPGPVHVTLPRPMYFAGRVVDSSDRPVSGATVSCDEVPEVTSDAAGRFRIGPVPDRILEVTASRGSRTARLSLKPGPGELVLRLPATATGTVHGVVRHRGRPVRRFSIRRGDEAWQRFVDEDGRFEVAIDRQRQRHLLIAPEAAEFGDSVFPFALPEPGSELIAEIPVGAIHCALEGGATGHLVQAGRPGEIAVAAATVDRTGVARLGPLAPGRYQVRADGYAPVDCIVGPGDPVAVALALAPRQPRGAATVRWPDGTQQAVHGPVGVAVQPFGRLRLLTGEGRLYDWLENPGELELRSREPNVSLERVWPHEARLIWGWAHRGNAHSPSTVVQLGAGSYRLTAGPFRRTVTISRGSRTLVDLSAVQDVRGRVLDDKGLGIAGASVTLGPAGSARTTRTDPSGSFLFASIPTGRFRCVARVDGRAPAASEVVVAEKGVVEDGFPLVLRPSARTRIRVVDPTGAPVDRVEIGLPIDAARTDPLGYVELAESPAVVDIAVPGYARISGREVRDGDVIRLVLGADLVVDASADRITLEIENRKWLWKWDPTALADRTELTDLPAGQARLVVASAPESGDPPREYRFRLRAGKRTTVRTGISVAQAEIPADR